MKLLDLAIFLKDQLLGHFPNKVGIIILYGSVAQRTEDEFSDLDMYAIVDDQEDTTLPWEFIFHGHTVDFWKMDWRQAELMASGDNDRSPWAVAASLFTEGRILHKRSDSDKIRFNSFVSKIRRTDEENLKHIIKEFNSVYSHLEEIKIAKRKKDLLSARWAIWQLTNKLTINLSLMNNSYLTKNWGSNLHEIFQFPIIPPNFRELVTILCTTNNYDEMIRVGRVLIQNVRKLILKKQQNIIMSPIYEKKAFTRYVSMKAYINKIISACHKGDILTASYAVTELQIWIAEELNHIEGNFLVDVDNFNSFDEIKVFYNRLKLPDLMDGISQSDFQEIEKRVNQLDLQLLEFCKNQNSKIPRFNNKEEIKKYLS
ncbi:MAG: hypothetical protein ACFFB2_04505 [Promethearchaeota archaeon]